VSVGNQHAQLAVGSLQLARTILLGINNIGNFNHQIILEKCLLFVHFIEGLNVMIKRSFFFLLFFISISAQTQFSINLRNVEVESDSVVDVFPLAIGNEWTYNAYWEHYYDPYSPIFRSGDSGIVKIRIVDKVIMVDSIIWRVQSTNDLYQFVDYNKTLLPTKIDTIEVVERLAGKHQLYVASDSLKVRRSVIPFSLDFPDTALVYRFSSFTSDSIISVFTRGWPGFNRFIFRQGLGLLSFYGTDGCTCMSGYDYRHNLISSILSKIENTHLDFPTDYNLSQNYPNPFNPTTRIDYDLPTDGKVTLKIYDMLGCEVKTLVDEYQESGKYTTSFDAGKLSSGIYIYKLVSGSYSAQRKMLLLK